MISEPFIPVRAAAFRAGVAHHRLKEGIALGELTVRTVAGGPARVRMSEVVAFADSRSLKRLPMLCEPLITVSEAARAAGIDYALLLKFVKGRRVAYSLIAGKKILVKLSDVELAIKEIGYVPEEQHSQSKSLDESLADLERRLIGAALCHARGNRSRAAELLGISRPRLYRRVDELKVLGDHEKVGAHDG